MKKKIFLATLAITLVFSIAFLYGCRNSSTVTNPETKTESEIPSEDLGYSLKEFREVEPAENNLHIYREEVEKRINDCLENNVIFMTDIEQAAIKSIWEPNEFKILSDCISFMAGAPDYNYPVIFKSQDSLILWYTDENGAVLTEDLNDSLNNHYIGHLHAEENGIQRIFSTQNVCVTYDENTNTVEKWVFGIAINTAKFPTGTIYCGFSEFEGFIFKSGTDVYALNNDSGPVIIAHNVKYVIETEYYCGSDPWSQPIFLMEDGSIKVYIHWEGDMDSAPDDESHLVDPYYEGSYKKFRN